MRSIVIGVGSNLGSREASIRGARALLDAAPRARVSAVSSFYETAPVGPPQPDYLNAALKIETNLDPPAVLDLALATERRLGRDRSTAERWGPRSIDLDVLWDERGSFINERLSVPHVELERRAFALTPLLDVAPELSSRYQASLEKLGGPLPTWTRLARHVHEDDANAIVESDEVADACALAVSSNTTPSSTLSTEHRTVDSSASAFADAINALARIGFVTHLATISHCSNTQWIAHFHGVNEAIPRDRRVSLETTSGAERTYLVRATIENPID